MVKQYKCKICGKKEDTIKLTLELILCEGHLNKAMDKTLYELLHGHKKEQTNNDKAKSDLDR